MKIKEIVSKFVAIIILITLFSGYQFNNQDGTMADISTIIGIEEAYAGPCNDNGCVGGEDNCMEVSILWGAFKRTCWTTKPQEPTEVSPQEE